MEVLEDEEDTRWMEKELGPESSYTFCITWIYEARTITYQDRNECTLQMGWLS